LRKKFSLCAATVLHNDSIASVSHLIETMDGLADVRELTAFIMSGCVEQGKLN